MLRSAGPISRGAARRPTRPDRESLLPRRGGRFELVVVRSAWRAADVQEAPAARLLRIGEIEVAIDRQRALPDLAWRHAPRPAASHLPQRRKRTLVELGQLRARRDGRIGPALPVLPRTAA